MTGPRSNAPHRPDQPRRRAPDTIGVRTGPVPTRLAPRARHLTREHVCQGYVLVGYPAISRVK